MPDYEFAPEEHERDLLAILEEVEALPETGKSSLDRILRRHPKNGSSIFSRSELIAGYRYLAERYDWPSEREAVIEKAPHEAGTLVERRNAGHDPYQAVPVPGKVHLLPERRENAEELPVAGTGGATRRQASVRSVRADHSHG